MGLDTWEKERGYIFGIKGQWEWLILVKENIPCSFCSSRERDDFSVFWEELEFLIAHPRTSGNNLFCPSKLGMMCHPLCLTWSLQASGVHRITVLVTLISSLMVFSALLSPGAMATGA